MWCDWLHLSAQGCQCFHIVQRGALPSGGADVPAVDRRELPSQSPTHCSPPEGLTSILAQDEITPSNSQDTHVRDVAEVQDVKVTVLLHLHNAGNRNTLAAALSQHRLEESVCSPACARNLLLLSCMLVVLHA